MRSLLWLPLLFTSWFLLSMFFEVLAIQPFPKSHTSWALPRGHTRSIGYGSSPVATTLAPTATIDVGVVIGTTTSLPTATASVNKFLGVPFAKSPPERFAPPERPGRFSQPINATAWSPACVQQFVYPLIVQEFTKYVFNDPGSPTPVESEDCLYLNVYAPSSPPPADGRAVLFWLFGGGLQFGNAGQVAYDGSAFASYEDVIVVTTNYRTNVFGFPSSPELPETGHNLGFLDQRLALDWVQRNIAAFGGSPDKVTIFGESAGGFSIDAMLTSFSPGDNPPFRGAILQSGQYSFSYQPRLDSTPAWYNLSAELGCPGSYGSNLTCVRAANASQIKSIVEQQSLTFNPFPDNVTLASNTAQRRITGDVAQVPVLGGSNSQEGRVFEVGATNTSLVLHGFFGDNEALISAIEAAYPLNSPGIGSTPYDQLSQVVTELVFQCPQALFSNITASFGVPQWRYIYNASYYSLQRYPGLGVYHSSEIPIVFGTYLRENATTQQVALSNSMMGAWARFAKNPVGGPGWNPVGTGSVGDVLVGAYEDQVGGIYSNISGDVQQGAWDLGIFGNRGDVQGSGVTVIDQYEVDYRCGIFRQIYETADQVTLP